MPGVDREQREISVAAAVNAPLPEGVGNPRHSQRMGWAVTYLDPLPPSPPFDLIE